MNKKIVAAVSHHDREVAELRADRECPQLWLGAAPQFLSSTVFLAVKGLWGRAPHCSHWEFSGFHDLLQ